VSTHAVSRSPQRGGQLCVMRMGIPSCMLVCAAQLDAAQQVAEIRSTYTSRAAQAWYTYIYACSQARTATRMRASSLHTYQICKRSTHAAVQHRASTSIYIDMYACGLHVQVVQHRCVCRMQTHSDRHVCMWSTRASRAAQRVCTDAHALFYAMPHIPSHTFHFLHPLHPLQDEGAKKSRDFWCGLLGFVDPPRHTASIAQLVRARA
jgi:hypothetical protein